VVVEAHENTNTQRLITHRLKRKRGRRSDAHLGVKPDTADGHMGRAVLDRAIHPRVADALDGQLVFLKPLVKCYVETVLREKTSLKSN